MVDSNIKGPGEQHLEKTLYVRLDGAGNHDHATTCAMQVGAEHGNLLSLESSGLYIQHWYGNGLEREHPSPALPLLIENTPILEDDLWSDLLLSQSHTTPSLHDVEMQDEADQLAEKRSVTCLASRNNRLTEVLAEMAALTRRSPDTPDALDHASSDYGLSPKSKAVHWPEEVEVEREPKRLKSGGGFQAATIELDPTANAGPGGNLPLLPLGFLDIDNAGSGFHGVDGLESLELVSPSREGPSKEIDGHPQETSSPESTSSESRKSNPLSKSTETVSKNFPGSFGMAKSYLGTDFGRDQNVSPNVFHPLPSTGRSQGLLMPSVPVAKPTPGGSRSLMERSLGGRGATNGGAQNDSSVPKESRWAEQLLLDCAIAISSKNFVRTQHLMWVLNDLSNLTGDANQRLAAHGLKALFCRVNGSGEATNPIMGQVNAGPQLVHRALLKFHEVNPWHQMVYTVANSVMLDNFEGEDKVHVIDIGVSKGTQWPTFIEALATRPSGPPALLRLTVVKEDGGVGPPVYPMRTSSTDFMARLERFAKLMGINIALTTVVSSLEGLTREKLGIRDGEALAICTQFRLHRLSETTSGNSEEKRGLSPRDAFLHFLHGLKPKVFILSENDADHLSTDFLTRFRAVVDYFWKFLDSTSFSFHGKHCEERQTIEHEAASTLMNNVAYEGDQRIERNDSHAGWTMRMKSSGFQPVLAREEILDNIRSLIRKYDANWEYAVDIDCVVLLWKQQPVTFCSVWKPTLSSA